MPGLCGFCEVGAGRGSIARLSRLIGEESQLKTDIVAAEDAQWGVARSHSARFNPKFEQKSPNGMRCFLRGEVALSETVAPSDSGRGLVEAFQVEGVEGLQRAHGAFCGVFVDEASSTLTIFNDRLGSYPLYWATDKAGFFFGASVLDVLRLMGARMSLDTSAAVELLLYGFVMAERTLTRNVRLLEPGTTMSFRWADGSSRATCYAEPRVWFSQERRSWHERRSEVLDAFKTAVERATHGNHRLTISLSGGLDSRTILSAMSPARTPFTSFTCGVDGNADQVVGAQLAGAKGVRHTVFRHDARVVDDLLENLSWMVRHTDGMYLSHGLTEIQDVGSLASWDADVLIRGHGGELAKMGHAWPFHVDRAIHSMGSNDALADYLTGRLGFISTEQQRAEIVAPELLADMPTTKALLADVLAKAKVSPLDGCSYLYLYQHHRRFTIASLELFRRYVEIRMPFVDENFLKSLMGVSDDDRGDTGIHQSIIRAFDPELGNIRNSNTGAAANAGPISTYVMDKFNTLLKRMNVTGYRHYHEYDRLVRGNLLAAAESQLQTPNARIREFIAPGAIQMLLERARHHTGNVGYLLQGLLLIELWMQLT